MSWVARLGAWWSSRKPKRVDDIFCVEFDEHEVRLFALDPSQADWNQRFLWDDITRVWYRDEGIYASDLITIELGERQPAIVPVEARGGAAFFGRLVERGYFPEQVSQPES